MEKLKKIILICAVFLASFSIEYLQKLIFAQEDYLLFINSRLASLALILLVFFILDKLKYFNKPLGDNDKITDKSDESAENAMYDNDDKNLNKKILAIKTKYNYIKEKTASKIIKKCWIPILLIIILYCGFCKNAVLYADNIKITSAFSPKGIIYSYNDVKSVNVGIKKKIFFDKPYYEIVLVDGKRVDFYKDDNDLGNKEIALVEFDNKLKILGANKNVDKKYYDKYFKNTNDGYNNAIKKLFNDY